ncbi:MAG: AAA family ATPase, partial [Actinobacteria bacterium]|nr:AAA family ATPase [Actinomycetota bacterium]
GRAALVGRVRELDLLVDALAQARAASEPQLVTLVGVPGIGKSRLVSELARIADEDDEIILWRQGRSLAYGEGVAFWALGEIVKAQVGILESDTAADAAAKLTAALGDLLPEADAIWVGRHLRPLIGLGGEGDGGEGQQAEAFAAWRRFFEALGERSPTVVVFEDLHWAEDGLLDFVDGLVERLAGVPLLVVCSARPELLERRPGWGGGKRNAHTISLAPLSDDDTARLIATLLDRPLLAADQQAVLLQRAGGNPLYAEEYARMSEAAPTLEEVPDTLQGVVAARIDALASAEKELLQQASVLGKVFWTDGLAALLDVDEWDVDERLHALERKEFVRRERRSAVADAKQYVFVHALVRDGAYGQMPRAARGQAHARVADWIDLLPSDRADDRAEMLAHHLVQAVEYGRAAGLDVTALLPRAARAARDAGDRAWALGAPGSALALYEQSRSLDPATSDDPYLLVRLGRALFIVHGGGEDELEQASRALAESDPAAAAEAEVAHGEVFWLRGDQGGAFPYFERAAATVATLPPSRQKLFVVSQVARFLALAGRSSEGLGLVEEAIAMAKELDDHELLSDALNTRGIARRAGGDAEGIDDIEQSLALALEINSWRAGRGYINLGSVQVSGGNVKEGDATFRQGLRLAERLGVRYQLRWVRGNLAETTFHLGLWDEALGLAEAEIADPEPHYLQQLCRTVRAHTRLVRDDGLGAVEDAELGAEEARAIRDPQALIPALASLAFLKAWAGDTDAATVGLEELEDALREVGSSAGLAGPWVVQLAFALLELGRASELLEREHELGAPTPWRDAALAIAHDDLIAAADTLAAIGSSAFEAHVRLRAAQRLSGEGRRAEAAAQLTSALSFYRGVGASAAVREGETLLAAAS